MSSLRGPGGGVMVLVLLSMEVPSIWPFVSLSMVMIPGQLPRSIRAEICLTAGVIFLASLIMYLGTAHRLLLLADKERESAGSGMNSTFVQSKRNGFTPGEPLCSRAPSP